MLRRAHHAGVERVEVHIERIGDVARHHRPLEEMDVVEPLDDARRVVDVLQQRLPVFVLLDIDQMHRRARRAVMHALALDQHVVLRVLPVQGEIAGCVLYRVEHQRARKADAAVGIIACPDAGQRLYAGGDGVGEADGFEQRQHRLVDALEVVVGDRLVAAAFHTGPDRPHIVCQRGCPHRPARLAASGSARGSSRQSRPAFRVRSTSVPLMAEVWRTGLVHGCAEIPASFFRPPATQLGPPPAAEYTSKPGLRAAIFLGGGRLRPRRVCVPRRSQAPLCRARCAAARSTRCRAA